MTAQVLRVSLSIPKNIVSEVDELAGIRKLSRSKIVSECLQDMVARERRETTASGMRNNQVMMNPIEMPIAPLISEIKLASKKIILIMVFGLAPRALMMPSSRC